jgi:hypothetical protein
MRAAWIILALCGVAARPAAGQEVAPVTPDYSGWVVIRSAKPVYRDRCIADVASEKMPRIKFAVRKLESGSHYQQWRMVRNGDGGRVNFVNRATGNVIGTTLLSSGNYCYVQPADEVGEGRGWFAKALGGGQYEVYGEDGGLTRYWCASVESESPDKLTAGDTQNTGFAWIFAAAESVTGVSDSRPAAEKNIRIYAQQRKIVVEGCNEYSVVNVQGAAVPKNVALPMGIYFVTVEGKTTKVLIVES